jgi:DNA-directed RNA polymerase II subunit RPB2
MENIQDETLWKIINSYFDNNPQSLVRHHVDSYNDFFKTGIFQIFKEKNPITIYSKYDDSIEDFRHQCTMYFGGKNGDKIYFGKPVIYDKENPHYMFPNEARLRNMTYGMTIHYDIEIEFTDILEPGQMPYAVGDDMLKKGERESDKRYKKQELEEDIDYTEEHEEEKSMKAGNFKHMEGGDELKEEEEKEGGGEEEEQKRGVGPKKVERKKRVKSVEVEMTPNMALQLREAYETSMVTPNTQKRTIVLEKIFLGKFPIMVQSEFCILNDLPRDIRFSMGECKNDLGGYFIIDGKEKTIIPQEKFADNMLYIRGEKKDEYLCSAEIRSVSENVSKPIRTFSVRLKSPSKKYSFKNIEVNIPNVRNPVPLFIVFRALGIISDKEIITMCLLDLEKYDNMMDLFIPSVHDAGSIMTQKTALMYIASLTKYGTVTYALEVLSDYFLPHVGEINYTQKAYYLGYIVFRLLSVYTGIETPTDRDNFKYKRIELAGSLIYDLFREYYTLQQREIHLELEKRLYFNQSLYADNLPGLIQQNYRDVLKERVVELGFKKAFKGNWGSQSHTKRVGVVQDVNRLSFNSMMSHLRKLNLPLDSSAKLVGPRVLHGSQWGFIDPIDTPDGANIGLHKSLAITTYISRGYSREPMIEWLREKLAMKLAEECGPMLLSKMTRIIVNGLWAGSIDNPLESVQKFLLFRRNALIPTYTSISFDIALNTIFIYTDAGRLCRPIFYMDGDTPSYNKKEILNKIKENDFEWNDLIHGFNKRKINEGWEKALPKIYELNEMYFGVDADMLTPARLEEFKKKQAILDYIDPSESESALIAVNEEAIAKNVHNKYTHLEIHESLLLGVMCNQITFPENNPPTRNAFSCGQTKQAVSMYHTNYQVRMDKTAVVLNNGQVPLVKTRFLEHINKEENPYGENTIVAIMCYSGYNMEDSILINEGALKRGLFNTTYFTVYETHEESSKNADTLVDKKLTHIESEPNVIGTKPGYDYSKLDKCGLIQENTPVTDKTVLIGMTSNSIQNKEVRLDLSKTPKKGQIGVVDKSFLTEGEEGERIAKVRIREIRVPNLGDKMASRNGQKGTVGLVVPECDMPFTKDGLRPDLIINPHAIPSRMTIGQLVECIIGKTCAHYGGFADCTAFINKGSKVGFFGEQLSRVGFHSTGNEILYNGMTGEQLESNIFIGPTYYMRLKHMVKDKINYRARGPMTALTRQPVSGRANDGGLRIGEMERDVLISHGINNFLKDSMMDRGDKYYMAICNQTGMMAVYNPAKNLFMSPMADGPIRFTGSIDQKDMHIENITRYGRDFSIVCLPYSFKLLMQELQTINIQMRLITEDNIEQLENMSFSKNIEKLMQVEGAGVKDVMDEIKERIQTSASKEIDQEKGFQLEVPELEETPAVGEPGSPEYAPYSPVYVPNETKMVPVLDENGSPVYTVNPTGSQPYYEGTSLIEPPPQGVQRGEQPYLEGGGQHQQQQQNRPFQVGEMVYYRGGIGKGKEKPNRIWNVRDSGGGEYITIETQDMEGLDDVGDSIKVVRPFDIYRMSDIVYGPNIYDHPSGGNPVHYDPYQQQQQMMMPANPYGMGGINVNPVIKIVNGPDHSVDLVGKNGETSGGVINPMMGIKSVEEKKPINDGEIDFNKLIIKKV